MDTKMIEVIGIERKETIVQHWLNSHFRLWRIYEDKPLYCSEIAMRCITLESGKPIEWKCEYCGATVPDNILKCPGCQSSRGQVGITCYVELDGRLPHAMHLFDLNEDSVFELHCGKVANPTDYEKGIVVARFTGFKPQLIRLPNTMTFSPGGVNVLTCYVTAECEAEFYFSEKGNRE